jgi:Ca2+-binding EF-hand superfamily protein
MIDCEVSVEMIKQRLSKLASSQLEKLYKSIDRESKGLVSLKDLRSFLEDNNHFPNEKELQLLFERMDKDEDREISFSDFVVAVTPFMQK